MNPNTNGISGVGPAPVSQPAPTPVVAPVPPAENEEPISMEPTAAPKKKSNGMLIGMIILALVAAGGIGFGVYAFMDGNSKVKAAEEQVDRYKKLNQDLQAQLDELNGIINGNTDDDEDDDTTPSPNPIQSVSIDDWGVTINMPANLRQLSYVIDRGGDNLCVSGFLSSDQTTAPSFAGTPGDAGVAYVCIHRGTEDHQDGNTNYSIASADFQLEDYYYWVTGPQGTSTTVESETEWENETIQAFLTALKDKNNYSVN